MTSEAKADFELHRKCNDPMNNQSHMAYGHTKTVHFFGILEKKKNET